MISPVSFLDTLMTAADQAATAEATFRRECAGQIRALERERAFAHRRLNLMRSVAEAVASAEETALAVACSTAVLRLKLGWSSDSEARGAVLSRFAPIAETMFALLVPPDDNAGKEQKVDDADVIAALTDFEHWYAASHPSQFWALFDTYVTETPLVDF